MPVTAIDLIAGNHFSGGEPRIFAPNVDTLLAHGDYFLHLADLAAYSRAQSDLGKLYLDRRTWAKRAIRNVGYSGKFSSDCAVAGYTEQIWRVKSRVPGGADLGRSARMRVAQVPN